MKRFRMLLCLAMIFGLLVVLTGCQRADLKAEPKERTFFTYFDTVSFVYCYADDPDEVFNERCGAVSVILDKYHRLFDIYHEYSGVVNLRTLNLNAGGEPMRVDKELVDFLLYAKELYRVTGGEMNIMMGSVLRLWHDCREAAGNDPTSAAIPSENALAEAARHTDISCLEVDGEAMTVRITDPYASIDVGAIGKGYATEMAARYLKSVGAEGYVLNIGGNLRMIGHKSSGDGWITGIKDPRNLQSYAVRLTLADVCCVTSGDYERFFTVDGKKYHHIIDKDTLMPSVHFSSVTVIAEDSGLADALSTALFNMSYREGLEIVSGLEDVDAIWITPEGEVYYTERLEGLMVK